MLELFAKHSGFDLELSAKGDIEVDFHHTVEDIGIVLGTAVKKIFQLQQNIYRYGYFQVPMDESLSGCVIDFSNRPLLIYNVKLPTEKVGDFDTGLIESFFQAFTTNAGVTLHINLYYGNDSHHIIESIFKCFAKSIKQALQININDTSVPSTKGIL